MPTDLCSLPTFAQAGKAALLAVLVIALGAGAAVGQASPPSKQSARVLRSGAPEANKPLPPTARELDDAATPIVDPSASAAKADDGRRQKNAFHDHQGIVQLRAVPRSAEVAVDDEDALPDLPVARSVLVAEGQVVGSQAFLSEDKTGIYSEFSIRVTEVLKTSPGTAVGKGATVTAERFGGRLRYPSGQIVRYRAAGAGSPAVGKRYLFFLEQARDGNYRILTAYELGDRVLALDGSRTNPGGRGKSAFDRHNGRELQAFRQDVATALQGVRR
jgi:hypothetical protein